MDFWSVRELLVDAGFVARAFFETDEDALIIFCEIITRKLESQMITVNEQLAALLTANLETISDEEIKNLTGENNEPILENIRELVIKSLAPVIDYMVGMIIMHLNE